MDIPKILHTKHTIWSEQIHNPGYWEGSYAIGNGRLGASYIANPRKDVIHLNENGIWARNKEDRINTAAYDRLSEIRELIRNGENDRAQFIADLTMLSNPARINPYQPFGQLNLEFRYPGKGDISDYERCLDLENALYSASWKVDCNGYFRESFASYPSQVIAFRFVSEMEKGLSLGIRLSRYMDSTITVQDTETLKLEGRAGLWGSSFCGFLRAEQKGGEMSVQADTLMFLDCTEIILYFSAASEFYAEDQENSSLGHLEQASEKGFDTLRAEHIADYQALYKRVSLDLGGEEENIDVPTDKRLETVKEGADDRGIEVLMFNLGRYFLISSSRSAPGAGKSLPANLQGLWNNSMTPPWSADYHININLQMNYWHAGLVNLSECQEPLNEWMKSLAEKGKIFAREHYRCGGWVAHHLSDPWGHAGPADSAVGLWPTGGAWMCLHLWDHYLFTEDDAFLKETAYPLMKGACEFFFEYLYEYNSGEETYLVCGPSMSPENRFRLPGKDGEFCLTEGATMDNMILRELFRNTTQAADILNIDNDFSQKARDIEKKLPPIRIGSRGQVMEWIEDYEENEPGHRHISQLFGLHPVHQITPYDTPELADAARRTIELRLEHGGGHTGWSVAWLTNMYARLHDGENAYGMMKKQLSKSTLPNLWDTHPPFQIDGNFGLASAVCEMLVQSNGNKLFILPALPPAWESGKVTGLRVKGCLEIDIEWENGKPVSCVLTSDRNSEWTVHADSQEDAQVILKKGEKTVLNFK